MSVAALLANAATVAVLAPCFWLVARAARRPPLTHLLALLLLVKLLTPPLFDLELPVTAAAPVGVEAMAATGEGTDLPVTASSPSLDQTIELMLANDVPAASTAPPALAWRDLPWREAALAVWALVAVALLVLAMARLARFPVLLRRFAVAASVREQARVHRLGQHLGLRRVPRLDLVAAPISPMLWAALGRPRVLVPAGHYVGLPDAERDALVAHELAHYARRDHWVRWLELVAVVAFWWHPVVWLARRALRRAEEECCDARVLEILPGQSRTYADALLGVIDFVSAEPSLLPVGASGMGEVGSLERRLTMIMQSRTRGRLSRWGKAGVAALGALVLPLGVGLAQEKTQEKSGAEPPAEEIQEPAEAKRAAEEARARDYAVQRGAASDRSQNRREAEARTELERLDAVMRERFEALMQEGRYAEAKATARRLREHLEAMAGGAGAKLPEAAAREEYLRAALMARQPPGEDNPLARIVAAQQAAKALQDAGRADDARNLFGALQQAAEAQRALPAQDQRPDQDRRLTAIQARVEEYMKKARAGEATHPVAPPPSADAAGGAAAEQIRALEKRVQALSEMIEKLSQEMAAQRGTKQDVEADPVRRR